MLGPPPLKSAGAEARASCLGLEIGFDSEQYRGHASSKVRWVDRQNEEPSVILLAFSTHGRQCAARPKDAPARISLARRPPCVKAVHIRPLGTCPFSAEGPPHYRQIFWSLSGTLLPNAAYPRRSCRPSIISRRARRQISVRAKRVIPHTSGKLDNFDQRPIPGTARTRQRDRSPQNVRSITLVAATPTRISVVGRRKGVLWSELCRLKNRAASPKAISCSTPTRGHRSVEY